jgi:PA14 domain
MRISFFVSAGVLGSLLVVSVATATPVFIPMSDKAAGLPNFNGDGLNGSIYFKAVNDIPWAQMAATGAVDGTFKAKTIDFPNGATQTVSGGNLGEFFGNQITGANFDLNRSQFGNVFKFDGYLKVPDPGTYNFSVASDDGFELKIADRVISSFEADRGFAPTSQEVNFSMAGLYKVSLLYFANSGGSSGIEFRSNLTGSDQTIPMSFLYTVIPAPSAAAMLGLGGLVIARRRR